MTVTICFVIPKNQNKKFKQKSFHQKAVTTSMLASNVARMVQAPFNFNDAHTSNIEVSILPAWATLHICKCHVTQFAPIACRYFSLTYINN